MKYAVFAVLLFGFLSTQSAHAENFRWQDAQTHLALTYPEDWRSIANRQPDDILTLAAPDAANDALCRVRVREDRRYVIYPRKDARALQHLAYSRTFWDNYMGSYKDARLDSVQDDVGLGSAAASAAQWSFESEIPAAPRKQAMGMAGLYNDKGFIIDCSAAQNVFQTFKPQFAAIIDSVEMRAAYAPMPGGSYRDFRKDAPIRIHGRTPRDMYVFN